MPNKIPPLEYPDRFEVRSVSANGGIRWEHHWVNVSTVCAGDYVGLEEIDDGSGMSILVHSSSVVFWSVTAALRMLLLRSQ
jgi:hypothetical protein